MAHTVTGASLQEIFARLNGAQSYHPLVTKTFSDWSTQAGDIVQVNRGEEEYQSPVHTSQMVWKGTPQITLNSTGNRERDAVSKMSRKKYGRGGAAVRANEGIHSYVWNTESTMYSYVDQTASYIVQGVESVESAMGSALLITASAIRSEVHAANSQLYSYVDQTATYIESVVADTANDLGSAILQTASEIRSEVHASNSQLYSYVDQTATYIESVVADTANDLGSAILQTASEIRSEVHASNSQLYSYVDQTATYIESVVADVANDLGSEILQTASQIYSSVYANNSTIYSYIDQTASGIEQVVANTASGLSSRITQQANRIGLVVEGTGSDARIKTASIVAAINDDGSSSALISADHIKLDGSTTVAGLLAVENGGLKVKGNAFIDGDLTMASGKEIIAGDIRATGVRFPGSNPGDDRTLTLSDVTGMIVDAEVSGNTLKLWKKGDPAATPSITFSKATSLSGTWSGSVLTVAASPQGNEYTVGFGSQTANQKLAVDIDRTIPPEPIVGTTNIRVPFHVYTPGTGQYDPAVDRWTGTASLSVGSLLEDKTSTNKITANGTYQPASGYMGFSSVEVDVPSQTITPVLTGGWNGTTFTVSSTPASTGDKGTTLSSKHSYDSSINVHYIDVDATDTGAQGAVTRARYVLALSTGSVSSGSRTIKVQYKGSDTGLEYVCNDYGNGQNAVTLNDAAWQYDGDNVSANNRNTNTVTVSTAGRPTQLSKSATVYLDTSASWSNNTKSIYVRRNNSSGEYVAIGSVTAPAPTVSGWSLGTFTSPYSYKPSVSVNGTTYTSGSSLNATGAYDAGWTAGQTGSSASSGARIELYRSPTGNIAYNTTYTIKAKGYSSRSATGKTDISGASITITTPADRYSDGQTAAGVSGAWGTGSGANVLTVSRALSSSTKSATYTVTAGTPTVSYNSSTHKYSITGTALVNNSQKASAVTSTGTEAYDGGVSDGKTAAGISASWGTGSGANVLTVSRALSSSTKSATYTVTAGVVGTYLSTTHKYSLTGTALVNSSQKASASGSTGTEAYDAGVSDGKTAAGVSGSWGTGSGANVLTVSRALSSATKSVTYTVTAGVSASYNSSTHKYSLTGTASVNSSQKASSVSSTGTEAYDAGYTNGSPNGQGTVAQNTSGTEWRIAVKKNDGTEANVWVNCSAIKTAYEAASGVVAGHDSGTVWRFAIKNGQGTEKNLWIDCAAISSGQSPERLGIYDVNGNKVTSRTISSALDLWAEYWIGSTEIWGDKVTITPSAPRSVSFSSSGTFPASTSPNTALAGWSPTYASGIGNSQNQTYRYIKFKVDGVQRSFYFT